MAPQIPITVLQLDTSPAGEASVSRELTATIADAIVARSPAATLVRRDLAAEPVPHLDAAALAALRPQAGAPAADDAVAAAAALNEALVREFLAADVVVVGAPMYNFSIPTQLKAWIDRVAQAGRTFRYTAAGPEGLAGDKKVVVVSSRGGRYAGQALETALDHQEAYLRTVFGFFGITDLTIVRAEGVALGETERAQAIAGALAQRDTVAARIATEAITRARGEELAGVEE